MKIYNPPITHWPVGRGGGVPAMIVGQEARSATVHHMWGSGQVGAHENLQQNKKNSKKQCY